MPRNWPLWALGICAALVTALAISRGADTARQKAVTTAIPLSHTAPASSRLDANGWSTVQQVMRLRRMALAARRKAMYRSIAASMALKGLMSLKPVRPGRCAVAVQYLYNNLLDLLHAYPGEDWQPLRLLIRKQPSLQACAPKVTPRSVYVG